MESAKTSIFHGHNVLILGQAGTGKSRFLRNMYDDLKREGKTVQALGTTGISSCNLPAGRTVHSFFGLLDGRFTNEQLISRINDDDNYFATKQRILSSDVVMIDECSMLSRKILEQIDFLCRKVRNTAVPFGGIQMCFFGDLFQLPPVPNHMYDDNGDSFISAGYKLHVYILRNVYRQTEADFVKAVHELSRGEVSDHTAVLMKSLSRDIEEYPTQKAVRLFALNYDVDLYNSKELLKLSGEIVSYSSHDSGDVKKLAKMSAPKTLYLKLDAPVMCIINMNDEIVNGLCGKIVGLEDDEISVYFPSLNKTSVFTRHSFTLFDREKGIDVGCRRQFPVRLSFALTVHKAQGLTIPKLVVDCRHMRNPGQIGVAIGRATELSNLQVLHFNRALVRRHKGVVYDFYEEPLLPIIDDLTCCKGIIEERKCEESTDSNKSDEEFDELREFEIAENEISTFVQEQGPITCDYPCPDHVDINEILSLMKYTTPITENQEKINRNVDILTANLNSTRGFADKIWNVLSETYASTVPQKEPQNKHITAFYKTVTLYLQSSAYRENVMALFKVEQLDDSNLRCAFAIAEHLRAAFIKEQSKEHFDKAKKVAEMKKKEIKQSKGGKSKIRYIGGWCIATLKYKKKEYVKSNLFKKNKETDVECVNNQVKCLDLLTVDEETISDTTRDLESLHEIKRKQNIRGGLTHITDETLDFFLLLDTKVQELETKENLAIHTTSFYTFILNELSMDKILRENWIKLYDDKHDKEGVSDTEMKVLLYDLYQDIIKKYLKMSSSQFRADYKRELKIEKEEAHRKNIRIRKEKQQKKSMFSYDTIIHDTSSQKIKSHLRLQSELSDNSKDCLFSFTREQLCRLCAAYNLKFTKNSNKTQLADCLIKNIPNLNGMVNPSQLTSQQGTSGSQLHTAKRKSSEKGKAPSKKSKAVPKYPCAICEKECENDCVACDACNQWFHFICLQMSPEDFEEDVDWYCNDCKA